jgi:hypothetical protein
MSIIKLTNEELENEYIKKNTLYSFVNNQIESFSEVIKASSKRLISYNELINNLRSKKLKSKEDLTQLFSLWRKAQKIKMIESILRSRIFWLETKNKIIRDKLWDIFFELTSRQNASEK